MSEPGVELIPFDEADIKFRVTMWTLTTERSTKSMTKRMQRKRTLFGPELITARRDLHASDIVRARALEIATEIAAVGEKLDRKVHTKYWSAWHRGLVGVMDGDVFCKEFADMHYQRDAKTAEMDVKSLVHGILNFAHVWCDDITAEGYLDFLQSMHSVVASVHLSDASRSCPCSPIAFSTPQRLPPITNPSSDSRRNSDSNMQRLLEQEARQTPTSVASTPGCAPLARGMRVAWVQGEETSPIQFRRPAALCERNFTPSAMARRGSAQSELGESVGRLDTEAQLKLWSPDVPRTTGIVDRANDSFLDDDTAQHSFAGNTSPWSLAAALNQSNLRESHMLEQRQLRESAPLSGPLSAHHGALDSSLSKVAGSPFAGGAAAPTTYMPPPIFVLPPYSDRPLEEGNAPQQASSSSSASRPHTSIEYRLGTPSHRSSPSLGNITPTHSQTNSVSPRALTVVRRTPQALSGMPPMRGNGSPSLALPAVRRNDIYSLPKPIG